MTISLGGGGGVMHGFLLQGEKGFRPLPWQTIIIVFLF